MNRVWGILAVWAMTAMVTACGSAEKTPDAGDGAQMVNRVGKTMPADAVPASAQTLRQALVEPSTLDVGIALFKAQFIAFLFEQLVVFDDNLELKPAAAASWSVGPDKKTWTIKMRPGGKWSDGRPVTAYDFEWSFQRLLDPASGNIFAYFYYPIKGAQAFNTGKTTDPATLGVKALDETTLTIETTEPWSHFPYILAFFTSVPAPRWQVEKFGTRWTDPDNCVSNSTWMLENWNKGRDMTFALNEHYNGPFKGYLERLHFKFVEGGWRGLAAYENDEFDRVGIDGPDFIRVLDDPVLSKELNTFPNFGTYYLIFQTTKPPFDNVKLRQAIAHAIDRESICNIVMSGTATPAYGMLPKGFPGYQVDRLKPHQAFDLALARKLLAEAGYPDGKGVPPLELWVRGSPPTPLEQQAVVAIQQGLKDHLGITVSLRNMTANEFNDHMVNHRIPWGFLWFNMDYPDPSDMIAVPWRSQPAGAGRQDWKNDVFDGLVDAAAREFDEARRVAMYQEAEEILAREAAGVFLFNMVNAGLNKPRVKGIDVNKYGDRRWSGLTPSYAGLYIGKSE